MIYVKLLFRLVKGCFAVRKAGRNVGASLGRERNVIIPQPHPGERLFAASGKMKIPPKR